MKRHIYQSLKSWKTQPKHKPIILREARQVGKTYLVNEFSNEFANSVHINFEKQPEAKIIFDESLAAQSLIQSLEMFSNQKIIPGKTLLFLDEIQEAPRALIALRYFHEECPELHVIAAGSLLDFAIEKVGIPVGRVRFLYMYPMSFTEFLEATDNVILVEAISKLVFPDPMPVAIHEKLLKLVAEYMAIGGMPEVVATWCSSRDIEECGRVQQDIIASYQQDFEKYCKKNQIKYAELIFSQVPNLLAQQIKFSRLSQDYRKRELAPCLDLLTRALVINKIYHSDGQGLPLGAQKDLDKFKLGFLDIALAQRMLKYHPKEWFLNSSLSLINKGNLTEAFVGQEILAYSDPHDKTELYFWKRHSRNSNAEIDYLIAKNGIIYPMEVKSGSGTTLKSMHMFLETHPNSPCGIRISTHNFSDCQNIHSYPLYAIANIFKNNLEN